MTIHSGRFGVVNGETSVQNWTVNDTVESMRYVHSGTKSAGGRKAGIRDWTGSYSQYRTLSSNNPGDAISFVGHTAPSGDEVSGGTGGLYTGAAIIDSQTINWNWEGGELITMETNFSGNGALVPSEGTQLVDSGAVDPAPACGTKLQWDNTGYEDWPQLTNMTLTLTAENQAYVNSSSVISSECWRQRKKGNFDWTLSFTEQNSSRVGLPDVDDLVSLRCFTNATLFYELIYGRLLDFSNITVDVESGAIISRQCNIAMSALDGSTLGSVEGPGAVAIWPYT